MRFRWVPLDPGTRTRARDRRFEAVQPSSSLLIEYRTLWSFLGSTVARRSAARFSSIASIDFAAGKARSSANILNWRWRIGSRPCQASCRLPDCEIQKLATEGCHSLSAWDEALSRGSGVARSAAKLRAFGISEISPRRLLVSALSAVYRVYRASLYQKLEIRVRATCGHSRLTVPDHCEILWDGARRAG